MGAVASLSNDPNLDKGKKEFIISSMRKAHEEYATQGLSDTDLASKMTTTFENLMKDASSKPTGRRAALSAQAEKLVQTGLRKAAPMQQSENSSSRSVNRPKAVTRRRSYGERDASKLQNASKAAAAAAAIVGSQSEVNLKTLGSLEQPGDSPSIPEALVPDTSDHWDSVSQLPFCSICQMAFKSHSVLDRHVKYSELHLKAVRRLEEGTAADAASLELAALPVEPKPMPRQVEGQDYKLLYYGSKFFWRSQDNMDLSFFHHMTCSCIEVVPFDVYKNKELERLYFDLGKIHDIIDPEVSSKLQDLREAFKIANKADKFQSAVFAEEQERAQLTRVAITTHILTRLHLHQVVPDKPQTQIVFITSLAAATPLLPVPPSVLIPVTVTHRRNTSTEEVKLKLNELENDKAALSIAISKAEMIASLVHRFASIMSHRKFLMSLSVPRRRWMLAIRKIIHISSVKKFRAVLEERDAARRLAETFTSSPVGRRKRGASQYIKEHSV